MPTHQSAMKINERSSKGAQRMMGRRKEVSAALSFSSFPSPIARFSFNHAARVPSFKCDPNSDDWTLRVKPRWVPLFGSSGPPDQFSWFCR